MGGAAPVVQGMWEFFNATSKRVRGEANPTRGRVGIFPACALGRQFRFFLRTGGALPWQRGCFVEVQERMTPLFLPSGLLAPFPMILPMAWSHGWQAAFGPLEACCHGAIVGFDLALPAARKVIIVTPGRRVDPALEEDEIGATKHKTPPAYTALTGRLVLGPGPMAGVRPAQGVHRARWQPPGQPPPGPGRLDPPRSSWKGDKGGSSSSDGKT
jgi:hypothetical protein